MVKTPYNTLGYGGAQVLPDDPYTPLARMAQLGISPGDEMSKTEKTQFNKDRREGFDIEDIKAWEDVQSHKEISKATEDLRNVWQMAFASGFNIANPRTQKELQLQKMFNEKVALVKRASDLYTTQGERHKGWGDIIDKDKDQLNMEGTQANIAEWMKKDPFQRAETFERQLVWDAKPFDVVSHTVKNLSALTGVEEKVLSEGIDPKSGKIRVSTLQNIPEEKRLAALQQIWQFGEQDFKTAIANAAKEDVTFNADPGTTGYDSKLGEWYVNQFRDVKSGEKRQVRFYSSGGGININFAGSGIPERDPASGIYKAESDTISTFNNVAGIATEHTSPGVINLQGENMYGVNTPSKALSVDITNDFINTETGKPENQAGNYSVMLTKIVWLNVMIDDVKSTGVRAWENLLRTSMYRKGDVLDDEQIHQVNQLNDDLAGSGTRYRYKKVPYVIGRMKYGQVETGEKIESFNRSFRVPLSVIEKDIRAHKGRQWIEYMDAANAMTKQFNPVWGDYDQTNSSLDY